VQFEQARHRAGDTGDRGVVGHHAIEQVDHPVGHAGHPGVVGHQQDRLALVMGTLQQPQHVPGVGAVQVAGGLIGQQQARLVGQRPGQRDPLLFPAGEPGRGGVRLLRQAQLAEQFFAPAPCLAGSDAGQQRRKFHIVRDGHVGEQVEELEDEADVLAAQHRPVSQRELINPLPAQPYLAARSPFQPAEHMQQRRFTRTGRPHDRHELAAADRDVDAADGFHRYPV